MTARGVQLAVLSASTSLAAATMPAIGTYLEPWYTAREAYHWTFPAAGGGEPLEGHAADADSCAGATLLFADVDGDGRDDNIRAGCGSAGDGWVVALSNGANGWENASLWWSDGQGHDPTAERFVADLDGDGKADAVAWGAMDGWHVGSSDGEKAFGSVLHVFTMDCLAGSKDCLQRVVSEDLLWYPLRGTNMA